MGGSGAPTEDGAGRCRGNLEHAREAALTLLARALRQRNRPSLPLRLPGLGQLGHGRGDLLVVPFFAPPERLHLAGVHDRPEGVDRVGAVRPLTRNSPRLLIEIPSERWGGRAECNRTDVVGIFPDRPSIIRLLGTILAEQHDEWAVAWRYMSEEAPKKARRSAAEPGPDRSSCPPPARS